MPGEIDLKSESGPGRFERGKIAVNPDCVALLLRHVGQRAHRNLGPTPHGSPMVMPMMLLMKVSVGRRGPSQGPGEHI